MDIVTILIACYGAIVSTILGIRELNRDKRKISILLIREEWSQRYTVSVVNVGHRPITLADIRIVISGENVPRTIIDDERKDDEDLIFPSTLSDGEHFTIHLPAMVSGEIGDALERNEDVVVEVYDVEGNRYHKYQIIYKDNKYGFYWTKR